MRGPLWFTVALAIINSARAIQPKQLASSLIAASQSNTSLRRMQIHQVLRKPENETFAVNSSGELIHAQPFGLLNWLYNRLGSAKRAVSNKMCGLNKDDALQAAKHWHFQTYGDKTGDDQTTSFSFDKTYTKLTPATLEDVHLDQKPKIRATVTDDGVVFAWHLEGERPSSGCKAGVDIWNCLTARKKISCEDLLKFHESFRAAILKQSVKGDARIG